MDFLKEILGDRYGEFEQVINDYNAKPENKDNQIKLANLTSGEYVGVGKYNALIAERDSIQEKLTTAEGTITTLKKENKDNETLQQTIKTHEGTIDTLKKDYEAKVKELQINAALQAKLTDTKYPELLVSKFDKSRLVVGADGSVSGIDDQLIAIKEAYKDLFTPKVTGDDPQNKDKTPPGGKNPWSKDHFNLTEQGRLLRENSALAAQYKAAAGVK